jgi:peptidoglycan/xylan/chitin deacetylase (PgdA/CDA1 family)
VLPEVHSGSPARHVWLPAHLVTGALIPRSPGALVISLDLELHWGVRDHSATDGPYARNLHGARAAVPALLDLFARFDVRATWATVGMLCATGAAELARLAPAPSLRPTYTDRRLNPYSEWVGADEAADPLHFAPSLVQRILAAPGQEFASHTFSHFFAREPGQTAVQFAADLDSAIAAAALHGSRPYSLVFPRNQHRSAYDHVLRAAGFRCFRGVPAGRLHCATSARELTIAHRALRWLDDVVPGGPSRTVPLAALHAEDGLVNVPASFFLRPIRREADPAARLQRARLAAALAQASREGAMLHLWWHPHNFGATLDESLAHLTDILELACRQRDAGRLEFLSMLDVADRVLAGAWA